MSRKIGKLVSGLKKIDDTELVITSGGVVYSTYTRELLDMNAHVVCGYNGTDFAGTAIYAYLNSYRKNMKSYAVVGRVHLYPKDTIRKYIQQYFDMLNEKSAAEKNSSALEELLEKLKARPELASALLELVA